MAPALGLYAVDQVLRIRNAFFVKAQVLSLTPIAGGLTRVEARKPAGFRYEPGQWAFVRFPDLSPWESHPFSISSAPEAAAGAPFTFHIKSMGAETFTGRLFAMAQRAVAESGAQAGPAGVGAGGVVKVVSQKPEDEPLPPAADIGSGGGALPMPLTLPLRVMIDGPYGRPAVALQEYDLLLMVCGGVGVTPSASLLADIVGQREGKERAVGLPTWRCRKTVLSWSNPGTEPFGWFRLLLLRAQALAEGGGGGGSAVQLDLRATRSSAEEAAAMAPLPVQ